MGREGNRRPLGRQLLDALNSLAAQGTVRTSLSPGVGGELGFIAGFGEKGVQRGYHLCALPDRRRNALDRSRAHVADREYAGQAGFARDVTAQAGAIRR
jgi:hypothetical protein